MADHEKYAALARRLIAKHGRFVTLQKLSSTAADPNKPWKGTNAPTVASQNTVKAVFVPISSAEELGIESLPDELLKTTNQLLLVAGDANNYQDIDQVLDGGLVYGTTFVQVLKPAGLILLYYIGVRR